MEKSFFNLSDNVNTLSLLGALLILLISFFVIKGYFNKMKEKSNKELSGDTWDGIGELHNDLPVGWAITFILLIVWAIWYFMMGYPLNSYSQVGEYNEEVAAHTAKFEEKFVNADQETLVQMGEGIFLVQCSQCHGVSGDGINGKARDLSKWGNEEGIYNTIIKGSAGLGYGGGVMLPMGNGLIQNEDEAKAVSAYIAKEISAVKTTKNPELVDQGRELYANTCASCHGGDGNTEAIGMGDIYPSISNYGSSKFVVDVLNRGKKGTIGAEDGVKDGIGEMPNFHNMLNDTQKKAVGEFIISNFAK